MYFHKHSWRQSASVSNDQINEDGERINAELQVQSKQSEED